MNNIINFKKNIIKFINKKNIKYILIALFFIVVFIFSQLETNNETSDFILNTEINEEKEVTVIDTYPKNNSIGDAYGLNVTFSESIIDYDFEVTTKPNMKTQIKILKGNPYKLFIVPEKPWDYTKYEIKIESNSLREPYIFYLTFKEEEINVINELYIN